MGSLRNVVIGRILLFLSIVVVLFMTIATAAALNPTVIIVGAGMSGISAGKTLSDAGIKNILILEATGRIGGRMRKINFAGINVEEGANWVQGVNGPKMNPAWKMVNKLKLRSFFSDYDFVGSNTYQQSSEGDKFKKIDAETVIDDAEEVMSAGENFSTLLPPSGSKDISIMTYQRLRNRVPSTPVEMAVDYYLFDYEFAEPPRVTSLQNTQPLPTYEDFGEDIYFVADQRGYESIVYDLAKNFLKFNKAGVADSRLKFNKVVTEITYSSSGVTVKTKDGSTYVGGYVMVSPSIGVLQSNLIKFSPDLPDWKIMAIYQFNMAVYSKIFLKFPYSFWPTANGTNFFLYANERRGYYPIWQHFQVEYPGSNVLLVTVTDQESRRIEQQPDEETKAEAMRVLRDMFGKNIPDATDIYVPRWWSSPYFRGSYSNWPIGVNRYEFDQIRKPVGRVYFTGEHTSQHYNGFVHGAYLAGIDSANLMIKCIKKKDCTFKILPKDS